MNFTQWINEYEQLKLPFDAPSAKTIPVKQESPIYLGHSKQFGIYTIRVAIGNTRYEYSVEAHSTVEKIIKQFSYAPWKALNRLKNLAIDVRSQS